MTPRPLVLRALLVDDEPLARRELARLLAATGAVSVAAEAADVDAAASALGVGPFDVVFLDVRLGRDSGFALVPALPPGVALVFVTAYDEHAVRAFDVHALDYLLKPVDPERLAVTIERLRERRRQPGAGAAASATADAGDRSEAARLPRVLAPQDWLFLEQGGRSGFVRVAAIAAITAVDDYSRVHGSDGTTWLVHRTLADWEARLLPAGFARIHRSALVNLRQVLGVRRGPGGAAEVNVRGVGQPLAMSRRAAARLRSELR
jgi:two-component system LytT family response regulator